MSEIDDLRARVEELEGLLVEQPVLFTRMKLQPSERVFAGLLLSRQVVTREMFELVNYRTEADRPNCPNAITVRAYAVRQKLRPYGIELKSARNIGYYLDPADKERLRTMA